jgi:hypothetical protein
VTSKQATARRLMPMGSIPYLESNPASALEPIAQEVERVAAPSAVVAAAAVALPPERRDHRPAVSSEAAVAAAAVAQLAVSAARVARALVGVHQGAGVKAFCLPARPGSRRCYYSPQPIP